MTRPKVLLPILFLSFASVLLVGCGGQIQIDVPDPVKEAIESHTPSAEYGFYVLEEKEIQTIEELTAMTLLVCGDVPSDVDLLVAASTIDSFGKPLFHSSQVYLVNPNVDCQGFAPCGRMKQTISFKSISEKFTQERFLYKSRTSEDALLLNCINALHADPEMVLLIQHTDLRHQKVAVTEIVFK